MNISVVITAYNCARFLPEAIASVRAQAVVPFEIVVADDASSDDIAATLAAVAPDARHLELAHGGEGATRNRGVAAARGDVIAFLDGDDAWPQGRLAALAARLDAEPRAGVVVGRVLLVDAIMRPMLREDGTPMISDAMSFGAALIRRPVFDAVGPVREDLRNGCDIDWFLRAREAGVPIAVCDAVTLHYRRHGSNVSVDADAGGRAIADVIATSLRRRRARHGEAQALAPWRTAPGEP